MNKKIVIAAVATIIAVAIGISVSQSLQVQQKYSGVLDLDATYHPDKKYVEITFTDNTQKATKTTLEILGMEESFQKNFDGPAFSITVPFEQEPEYGWKTVPVTLVVEHPEFGKVGLKTDIHLPDEQGHIIFTQF
ncbi:MAG TPA: hypothetical protein VFM64_02665 [Candidatus Nitrosotenuis sp.]|nr:hypothetical protein [Candidatus Nitrosotenuis sp.]